MSLFDELKRRNVFRVGIAYAVAAWLLLQIADVLIDNIGAPDWVFPTLLMALGIGLPLALIFAWAFELTPEGIKRDHEVDRERSIAHQTGRKLDRTIIVVLVLAVGYLLFDKVVLQGSDTEQAGAPAPLAENQSEVAPATPKGPSVAVLPFTNMSNDPDNEYFSDGLTETLLHMLAQLPDLRVAARTSSFAFKGQNKAVSEIAAQLGVANILEGSVQRAGGQVRVTAQLIRADDGFHVWSQNYTRPLQDIFAIQDEIAMDVAEALGASLLGETNAAIQGMDTTDLNAYDRYLRGLEQQALFTYGSLDEAENQFEQALAEDPEFTDARLALIRNYLLKRLTGMFDNQELKRQAQPLIDEVFEQDPGNRVAEVYQSFVKGRFDDSVKSREAVREAIYKIRDMLAYVPTETFIRTSVADGLHFVLDETDAAMEVIQAGLLIDPLEADLYLGKGEILRDQDQDEAAREAFQRAIELEPGNPTGYGRMAEMERRAGNLPKALEWLRRSMKVDPKDHEIPYVIADTLYALDLPEAAEPYYARVQALAPGSTVARLQEMVRAWARHDEKRCLAMARQFIEEQVDNRRGAFDIANNMFVTLMDRQERDREAYDFLVQVRPEVANWTEVSPDYRVEIMKRSAIMLMSRFAEPGALTTAWEGYAAAMASTGWAWDTPGSLASIMDAIVHGDIDRAVTERLEHGLDRTVAERPWAHHVTMPRFFDPVLTDPRIVAALDERRREAAQISDQVQDMLLQPEWTN